MPTFLGRRRIDWHSDGLPPELRQVAADGHASLDSNDHTLWTFVEVLEKVARAHPTLVVDALVDGGYRQYHLVRAAAGKVSNEEVIERPVGATDGVRLPYDEVASVTLVRDGDKVRALLAEHAAEELFEADEDAVDLPLAYSSEAGLRAVAAAVAAAIDEPAPSFVADVEIDRFLVELAPGTANVRALEVVGHTRALVTHLLHDDLTVPSVPAPARDPSAKYEMALFWPEPMLALLQEHATRTDRSLSYIAQLAWKTSAAQIAKSDRDALSPHLRSYADAPKAKQTLYFPGAMADQIDAEATRLDASKSYVVQCAVVLAKHVVAALPAC